MERRIVLARSTKGMTEVAANSGALPSDLFELLQQIDGQTSSEELCIRLDGFKRGQTAARILLLREGGYITDHESTLVHRQAAPARSDTSSGAKVVPQPVAAAPVKSASMPGGRSIERPSSRPVDLAARVSTTSNMDKKSAPPSRSGNDPRPVGLGPIVTLDDAAIVQRTDKGFRATAGLERDLASDAVSFLTKIATPTSIGDLCIQTGRARASLVASVLDLVGEGYLEVKDATGARSQGAPIKAPVAPPVRRAESMPEGTPKHSRADAQTERRPSAPASDQPEVFSLPLPEGRPELAARERPREAAERSDDRRRTLARAETAANELRSERRTERSGDVFAKERTDHVLGDIEATQRTIDRAGTRSQGTPRLQPVAGGGIRWVGKALIGLAVAAIAIGGGGYLVVHTLDVRRIETIAASHLGETVRIGEIGFSVWPRPALVLRDVTVGNEKRFRAPVVRAALNRAALFGSGPKYSRIDIVNAVVAADFFWAHASESMKPAAPLTSSRIEFENMSIVDPKWRFTGLSAAMTIKPSGQIQSMRVEDAAGITALTLSPSGPKSVAADLTIRSFQPKGGLISLSSVTGSGTLTSDEFVVREFQGYAAGTTLRGAGRLRIGQRWTFDGTVEAKAVDLATAAPGLFRSGTAIAQARFAAGGANLDALFSELSIAGSAALDQGVLTGVDFVRALQESQATGGSSSYNNGAASFQWNGNRLVISSLRVGRTGLSAEGTAAVDAEGRLSGRLAATSTMQEDPITGSFGLSGTLAKPVIRRVY